MTTEVKRSLFGISVGKTQHLSNQKGEFRINPVNDSLVTVEDSDLSQQTRIDSAHADLNEMIARAVIFVGMHKTWKVDSQTSLKNGEKTSIGPVWNRIHVSRRG